MRKLIMTVAAVAAFAVASNSGTCEAAGYYGYGYRSGYSNGGGFFSRLMDMERRKNAFLLRLIGIR